MLRSNINTKRSDFDKVKDTVHIESVWGSIERNIPIYFDKMLQSDNEVFALSGSDIFKVKTAAPDYRKKLASIFEQGIDSYHKQDEKYKAFFSEDNMQEFEDEDDPKAFKSALSTKVPVIQKARNSKRELMKDWQEKFARSKPADIYAIFYNLIVFKNNFVEETPDQDFSTFDDLDDLEGLIVLNEDDDYNVPGVIGMGIKSTVLYYLNPEYFLVANKNTLYGLYFLSDCESHRLPSNSNEFIMVNDMNEEINRRYNKNMLIDQNYWYPYDLFMLYNLKAYRLLERLCAKHKYALSEEYRFVHLNTFMSQIWNMNSDKITTMTGGDQEDAR